MQIWSQNASQITNIEWLNWNFNFWWNNFNLDLELNNNKSEIIKDLDFINNLLTEKWLSNSKIEEKTLDLKSKLEEKSEKWILESYKKYVKELKEVTQNTEELWNTITKVLNMWASIWKFITLLF